MSNRLWVVFITGWIVAILLLSGCASSRFNTTYHEPPPPAVAE